MGCPSVLESLCSGVVEDLGIEVLVANLEAFVSGGQLLKLTRHFSDLVLLWSDVSAMAALGIRERPDDLTGWALGFLFLTLCRFLFGLLAAFLQTLHAFVIQLVPVVHEANVVTAMV